MPTDPRFLAMTPEDIEAEYWAHEFAEHGIQEEIEDENFDENLEAMERDAGIPSDDDDIEEVINEQWNQNKN